MKLIDLTIPLGVGTPPWPTYEPLQVKYFKRLAPNGANGQLITHSNHLGTHLDGEIHFFTPGKDIAALDLNDFLVGLGVVVDLSDITGDYQIYTPEMIEERVEVHKGDILIIHTGYHHFYAQESPTYPMFVPRRYIIVSNLAVLETHRRQGIGRALMEAVEETACDMGISDIRLNVWEANAEALRFYEALGYETLSRYMIKRME